MHSISSSARAGKLAQVSEMVEFDHKLRPEIEAEMGERGFERIRFGEVAAVLAGRRERSRRGFLRRTTPTSPNRAGQWVSTWQRKGHLDSLGNLLEDPCAA